jgi:diguanylate cyclase (GGDEF)-like protein
LQAVAKILAAQARRPADVSARFGGEEFVLLLPNTNATGCQQIGETIRQSLAQLGIVHALNFPSGQVTVSIGGTTTGCGDAQASSCLSLVEAADRALYSAKKDGRDRLVMSGSAIGWAALKIRTPGIAGKAGGDRT